MNIWYCVHIVHVVLCTCGTYVTGVDAGIALCWLTHIVVVCDAHHVYVHMVEDKALGDCLV